MKFLIELVFLLLLSSCSLFKNTARKANNEHTAHSMNSSLNSSTSHQRSVNDSVLLNYRDSASSDYLIQLWPKGIFTFSQEGGFTGEAAQVLIRGKTQQSASVHQQQTHATAASSSTNVAEEKKEQLINDSKQTEKKTSVSWKTLLPLLLTSLIAGCLVIWFIIKKIRIWKI